MATRPHSLWFLGQRLKRASWRVSKSALCYGVRGTGPGQGEARGAGRVGHSLGALASPLHHDNWQVASRRGSIITVLIHDRSNRSVEREEVRCRLLLRCGGPSFTLSPTRFSINCRGRASCCQTQRAHIREGRASAMQSLHSPHSRNSCPLFSR